MRTLCAYLFAVAGVLLTAVAPAQPAPADRVLATELFKQGRELMAKGDHVQACPRFEESQRLDPGGGTLLNLALCHEAIGKTATAWFELNESIAVAQRDNRPDREQLAKEHLAALEPKLSRLVIEVSAEADLPDLAIVRGGSPVARVAWGTAIPVDPGEHMIEASAPERIAWSISVTVGPDADRQSVVIPILAPAPKPAPPPEPPPVIVTQPPPPAPAPLPPPVPTLPLDDGPNRQAMLISGIGIGGAGIIGIAIGTGFGVDAIDKLQRSDNECVPMCSDRGAALSVASGESADISTGAFIVGGVLAATGSVLIVWSLVAAEPEAALAFGPLGVRFAWTW